MLYLLQISVVPPVTLPVPLLFLSSRAHSKLPSFILIAASAVIVVLFDFMVLGYWRISQYTQPLSPYSTHYLWLTWFQHSPLLTPSSPKTNQTGCYHHGSFLHFYLFSRCHVFHSGPFNALYYPAHLCALGWAYAHMQASPWARTLPGRSPPLPLLFPGVGETFLVAFQDCRLSHHPQISSFPL